MLREMRGPHGGPSLLIRLLALVLALLLALPLSVLGWRALVALLGALG